MSQFHKKTPVLKKYLLNKVSGHKACNFVKKKT